MKIKQSKYCTLVIFLIVVVIATISCSDNNQDTIIDISKETDEPILKETVIDVFPNNTPCQIANLIRRISDNSPMNRYKLLIHDGEYEEIDILTKDYVDIEGEHQDKVTLFCDADATYNAPENYTLASQYSGMPVNEIPWKWKHVIIHSSNSVVRNLTLETRGGVCKYICHQDGVNNKGTAIFEKCIFKENTGSSILGVGIYADQFYKYIDCVFLTSVRSLAAKRRNTFNLHTQDNQDAPCGVVFENCMFFNTGHILVTELGSGQSDFWEFINCSTDKPENTFVRFAGISDNTPYNMILRVVGGGNLQVIQDETRKDAKLNIQNNGIMPVANLGHYSFGTALANDYSVAKTADNGFVFALSVINDDVRTISVYDIGFGLCDAGVYNYGEALYIKDGVFTKEENGAIAGYVNQAVTLEKQGYVMLRKK